MRIFVLALQEMATHSQALSLLCRIGGLRLSKSKQTTTYSVRENAKGIKLVLGVNVDNDEPSVHPHSNL